MIFDMTKRSGGGTSDVITGTSVSAGNYMIIPKVAGKNNFFAYVDADDSYFGTAGRAIAAYRLAWISDTQVFYMKAGNANVPPTSYLGGLQAAAFVETTTDSIKIKFPNANTAGFLPDGTPIRYMIW
jgi:hypothetical protein